jgi:hypothetical protein
MNARHFLMLTLGAVGGLLPDSGVPYSGAQTPAATYTAQTPASFNDLKKMLYARYDGKIVAAMVSGLYAGEQEKSFIGKGENALYWAHYHESVPVPKRIRMGPFDVVGTKVSDLHQLDEGTFGGLAQGLNVSHIEKGESLKVGKFYVYDTYIEFVLSTTGLGHLRDIDMQRASKRTTSTVRGGQVQQRAEVAGFGMVFRLYFDKDTVLKAANYAAVVQDIDKYLMPKQEAEAVAATQQNVEIDLGIAEDEVIQRLGQPLKSIRVGNQKSLRYRDMTVILKDGKVAEVKLE